MKTVVKVMVAALGVAIGFADSLVAEDAPLKMLFLGNSITWHEYNTSVGWLQEWGMAASEESKDYVHQMAADVERITGVAPTLRVRNIYPLEKIITTADIDGDADIAADVAFKPDVVVIAIGENFQGPSAAETTTFKNQIKKLAGKFTATTPLNKILIRSPFWQNTTQATLMKAAADELGVLFVDTGPLGNDNSNKALGLFSHSGVASHPGDKGMRAIADLMMTALFPDEFSPEIPSGGEEDPGTTPEAPVVTEVGEYAAVDGEGTVITRAPCIGGNTIRQLSNGEYVHVFTSDGTFYVNDLDANTEIQYLIVGGGGSGGSLMAGGGGGGGVRVGTFRMAKGALATIRVGKGGVFSGAPGEGGTSGTISDIWQDGYQINGAEGGGGGAGWNDGASDNHPAKIGASSGGQCHGRTSAVTATDGHRGGIAAGNVPGGGGGAGAPGADGAAGQAGAGGAGVLCCITGKAAYYGAGGGGGANWSGAQNLGSFAAGAGGSGVGGNGGATGFGGGDAVANTGSGGGGASSSSSPDNADPSWFGGAGADGIVVLRYAYSGEITDPPLPKFSKQVLLTVSGYEGEETLKDFPLLVRVSPARIEGFTYADCQLGGADIVFTTLDGVVLPCEVDTWNPEGESIFWVRVPQLAGRDTQLKMMWGTDKPVVNNGRDSAALWKDYAGVYHFSEQFGTAVDSSSEGNNAPLTSASYQYTAVGVDGKVGLARHVIGVANGSSLKMMNAPAITDHNNFTVSCWYKFISSAAIADYGVLWAKPGTAWNVNDGWFMSLLPSDGYPYICGKGPVQHHAQVNAKSGWHYLTMIVDGGVLRAGCDGVMTGISGSGTLNIQSSSPAYLGYCATCEIDELRIRKNSDVSADYIAAEYAQMVDGDFVVAEAVSQDMPEFGQVGIVEAIGGKARISLEVLELGEGAEWADIKVAAIPAGGDEIEYQTLGRVTTTGPVKKTIAGLAPGMRYEMRIKVENSLGHSRTVSKVFFTLPDNFRRLGFNRYSVIAPSATDFLETLTNFPLMVRVSPTCIDGFSYSDCRDDGKDVMFVASTGEFMASEIDTWNPTGQSIFWVKVPRYDGNTQIYLVWGRKNKSVIDSRPSEVWSDYVGVWHLNEASGNAVDSTGNGHDAQLDNAYVETCIGIADAKIGKARQIQAITTMGNGVCCSPLSVSDCAVADTQNFTVQTWYKYVSWAANSCDPSVFYAKNPSSGKWSDNDGWFVSGRSNGGALYFNSKGSTQTEWKAYLEANIWCGYVVTVQEGAVRLFRNGQLVLTKAGQESAAVTMTNPTYPILFGANVTCAMDEVRIRNKPVSAEWAKQEHAAMTIGSYLSYAPAAKVPKNNWLTIIVRGR